MRLSKYMSIVHDHFEGSAHCVECGGSCKQTGAERVLTNWARAAFEAESLYPKRCRISWSLIRAMEESGVNVNKMRRRASDTSPISVQE